MLITVVVEDGSLSVTDEHSKVVVMRSVKDYRN